MSPRLVLLAIAAGRTVLGVVALAAPELPARPWIGRRDASTPGARVLARALGARDLALGLGAFEAALSGRPVRPWGVAGAKADALDAVITVSYWRRLPVRGRLAVLIAAGGAAISAAVAAAALGPDGGSHG